MDHQYIDQHNIAGRYLRKELAAADRDAFLAHMVDCPECSDRVLLAEMFEAEKGTPAETRVPVVPETQAKLPMRARIVAYLSPWQIAMLFMLTVLILLAVFSVMYLWEVQNFRRVP